MKKLLAIYGAGGLGREVSLLKALPGWDPVCFYDDALAVGTLVNGLKVVGGLQSLSEVQEETNVILAIGSPETKQHLISALEKKRNIQYPAFLHPASILQDPNSISIGPGCIIGAGSIMTNDIRIGAHVLVNLNCTIGHNVSIGQFTSIMPGVNIGGEVKVGHSVLIGAGANIINRLSLGDHCKIGAGAVVIKSVPGGATAVGVPARQVIKSRR